MHLNSLVVSSEQQRGDALRCTRAYVYDEYHLNEQLTIRTFLNKLESTYSMSITHQDNGAIYRLHIYQSQLEQDCIVRRHVFGNHKTRVETPKSYTNLLLCLKSRLSSTDCQTGESGAVSILHRRPNLFSQTEKSSNYTTTNLSQCTISHLMRIKKMAVMNHHTFECCNV